MTRKEEIQEQMKRCGIAYMLFGIAVLGSIGWTVVNDFSLPSLFLMGLAIFLCVSSAVASAYWVSKYKKELKKEPQP